MFNSAAKSLILLGVFLFSCRSAIAVPSNDFSGENVGSDSSQSTESEDVSETGIRKPVITVIDINSDHAAEVQIAPKPEIVKTESPKKEVPKPEVTKTDLPKTELVELVGSQNAEPVPLYSSPKATGLIGGLGRGQIVSVTPALTSAAAGSSPGWRQIEIDGTESIWFKYDAKTMKTLNVSRGIAFKLKSSAQKQTQPLYRTPGLWQPADCDRDPTVCVAKLKADSTVRVHRAQLRHVDSKKHKLWLNFYEVSDSTIASNKIAVKGWIPASLVVDPSVREDEPTPQVPVTVAKVMTAPIDDPIEEAPPVAAAPIVAEVDDEDDIPEKPPTKLESGLFLFESNAKVKGRRKKLVEDVRVPELGHQKVASISGLTLRFDAGAGYDYVDVNQPFAAPEFMLQCVRATAQASTYLFLDLQMRLDLDFSLPVTSSDKTRSVQGYYFDSQEWLVYTTNWKIKDSPFKVGFGAYYIGLGTGQQVGGLPGLVGFQSKAILEGKHYVTGLRYAPVAQDLSIDLKNRILGVEVGYKFGDEDDPKPVQLNLKYDDIFFRNPATTDSTTLRVLGLGLTIPL